MELRIRVGASVDRSLSEAYKPLVKSAEQAEAALNRSAQRAAKTAEREAQKAAKAEEKAFAEATKEIEKWRTERARSAEKSAAAQKKAVEKAAKEETAVEEREAARRTAIRERSATMAVRFAAREAANENRERERATRTAAGISRRRRDEVLSGVGRAGSMVYGAGRAAGSFALSALGEIARGSGVDTDLGSMVRKNSDLESKATELSNSGYIAGDPRNQRVAPQQLMREALDIGKATGTDANDAVEGLIKFAGKTGDLATGREIIKDLAMYAKATGSNLEDMVDAAGDVSTALGDIPNKGDVVKTTMKAIAGQGKLGAVEIKNMASQMAKLAANATQIEGNAQDNIVLLGAFAQEARQRGGASSATMAATSVASMMNTFKTGARADAFKAATGKNVFNSQGMLRNPEELLMEALRAKGMDVLGFKNIFKNVQGARAVEGFATLYRQAGGGEAGEKAVTAEFERLKTAVLADTEIMDSFRLSMQTSEAQANVFNNTMREMTLTVQDSLKPSLMELAPIFVEMAKAGAGVVSWLVGTDARARQNEKIVEGQVGGAITNTNKQLGQGYILQQQLDVNKGAEKEAFENASRAKAEADIKNKAEQVSTFGKANLLLSDVTNPLSFLTGKKAGDINTKAEGRADERNNRAEAAQKALEEMHAENRRVGDLLKSGVISVRLVENATPNPPPGVSGAGRTPSPEQKSGLE